MSGEPEILRHAGSDPGAFPRVRSELEVLDELAGNFGLAEPIYTGLRRALVENPIDPGDTGVSVNRLRRRLLKARSFDDLSASDRETLAFLHNGLQAEVDDWETKAKRAQAIIRGEEETPPEERRPEDAHKDLRAVVVDRLTAIFQEGGAANGRSPRPHDRVKDDLREFLHYNAGQYIKGGNKKPYNFSKHRGDYVDMWLLTFCPLGYTLVTRDSGVLSTLRSGGCPSPRVVAFSEMIAHLAEPRDEGCTTNGTQHRA